MKKQLFILAALLVGSQVLAESAGDRLIDFHNLVAQQKSEWAHFMKEKHDHRTTLLTEQHKGWSDFHNKQIKLFMANKDWSEAGREKLLSDKLNGAIELHKKHMHAWEEHAKNKHEQGKELCSKHKAELSKFETQLEPAKKTHKKAAPEETPKHHKKVKHEEGKPEAVEVVAIEEAEMEE